MTILLLEHHKHKDGRYFPHYVKLNAISIADFFLYEFSNGCLSFSPFVFVVKTSSFLAYILTTCAEFRWMMMVAFSDWLLVGLERVI